MKTRTPFLPRMAYSAALPVSPLVAPRMFSSSPRRRQFVFEQVAQQLHGHVLERQRRAVGQGFDPGRARPARGGVSGTISLVPNTSAV